MDKKTSILVVEDEFIIAQDLQTTLQGMGYEVPRVLASAESVVKVVEEIKPDLILMDINLDGGSDGIEAAARVKEKFQIPILYLTSYTDEKTLNRAKVTEPHGYIIKPFHHRDLRTTIEMSLYKAEMDRKLKENQQWLSTILKSMGDGVISMDCSGIITFINPVAEILSGWTGAEAKGRFIDDVISLAKEKSNEKVKAPYKDVVDSGRFFRIGNLTLTSKGGMRIPIDENWNPIRNETGKVTGVVLICRNITEQKNAEAKRHDLEAQLLHAQKLESLGVLAGGIAHDFNNLLCIILGNASLALTDTLSPTLAREKVKQIEVTAMRASELVKQILSYSGKSPIVMERTDLSVVLAEMGSLLQSSISKKIELRLQHGSELPPLMADVTQLRQVVMNLILNASDAIGDRKGKIVVSTGLMEADEDYLSKTVLGCHLKPGKYIFLNVADDGCGMDKETRSKIFDPFFTTKFTGRGLGLAVVIGIVRVHGGAVLVESEVDRGTTFRILFPISVVKKLDPPAVIEDANSYKKTKRSGMVLVVDDEGNILTIVKEILEGEGFQVVTARTGLEGVEVLKEKYGEIVAIFLDFTMPDMDGGETLKEMLKFKSDIPVVLSSGYHEEEVYSRMPNVKTRHFLKKPFLPTELLRKVYEAMDEVTGTGH